MKNKRTDELVLGDRVSEPIFNKDGNLLLNKGSIINYEMLAKLKMHDINYINTLDELIDENPQEGIISEETMDTSINSVKKVFDEVMIREKRGLKGTIPDAYLEMVEAVVGKIMEALKVAENLLYTVIDLMDSDDYTYKHSVNVAVLSILTAKSMNYDDQSIFKIGLGALLHDIGKANVKGKLVQKEEKLSDSEVKEMMKHPEYGYEIVKDIESLPYMTKQIVRFHHEKLDGSGYPLGIENIEIPEYIRIVTLCDMYDAMTTNRSYRKKMPIHVALEILMRDAVYKIDANVYRHFTSTICIFPPGSGVMLSDGRIGIVSKYSYHNPTRPQIKVVDLASDSDEVGIELINLDEKKTLFIVDTWDVDAFKARLSPDIFADGSDGSKLISYLNEKKQA